MNAVISNAKHPEYGQVTIAFPIPAGQYENVLGFLDALKIGDTLEQDCQVDELESYYTILKRLEGSSVNIDELDYLAKRLDSFCGGEGAQFQGMTARLGIYDIRDFINLTFCCQQATVITDFSNLEQIGRDHYLNLNGGCASTEELNNLDGRETALLLIGGGGGVITPYGVVYDNGMKLEQLYDGRHFPSYYYDRPILALEAVSYENGATGLLCLPMPECQLTRLMQRAELERPDVYLKVDVDELPEKVSDALDLECMTGGDLAGLNRLCQAIAPMTDADREKLNAAVLFTDTSGIASLCRLTENLDLFDFIPNVHTPEEYGRYMIQESGRFEYDENLDGFYDYRSYGERSIREEGGQFNGFGYVAYNGATPLDELMLDEQQGPEMGGLSC